MLETTRIAGNANIVPDDDVKRAFASSGRPKLVTSCRFCLDVGGNVTEVGLLKSSGYTTYDAKIVRAIRAWKYRPFLVDGTPTPVCTAVSFIYDQAPPKPKS